jgi:hypothetical protein
MSEVSPVEVLRKVAAAIPESVRGNVIVVGSLAAGYSFFADEAERTVRTKDVDCALVPRSAAVGSGQEITARLLEAGWRWRGTQEFAEPASEGTPDDELPAVRLNPPDSAEWFVELLTVPDAGQQQPKEWTRIVVSGQHYGIPSFRFMSISTFEPMQTPFGIMCAQPKLMALANLLEHPLIRPDVMSALIEGRSIKRSNKDLGRSVAIARLSGPDEVAEWHADWFRALTTCLPDTFRDVGASTGEGLRELLASPDDLDEAWSTATQGLLASIETSLDQFGFTGQRLLADAVEPLERACM